VAKKRATAIDIGTDSVKVVQLENTSSGIKIVNFGLGRYPRADISDEIADETIANTLRDVLSQTKIKPRTVAISIPRSLMTVKKLTFQTPSISDEEIGEMVALQAEVEIPFGASNAVYNHHNLQRAQDGVSVELVATKKETVEKYMRILKLSGIHPIAILPSAYATSVLVLEQFQSRDGEAVEEESEDNTIMVVDIGARNTDLSILRRNRIAFSRSFTIGGDLLTKAYADERGLSYEEAEEYKISNVSLEEDVPEGAGTKAPLLHQWAEQLSEELRRSIQAFSRDMLGAEQIDNIWICGRSATIPGLDRYIESQLEIPTSLWDPFSSFGEDVPSSPSENMRYCFAISLGLGLNVLKNRVSVNLLPAEEKLRKERARQRIFTISYAAAALILVVGIFLGAGNWISSRNNQLDEVNEKLRIANKASQQANNLLIDDLVMANMLFPRVSPLDVLKELSEQFPNRKKIALTGFTLDKTQKITIRVEANSHADISDLISKLGRSGLFKDVKSGQIDTTEKQKGKQIVQAQITCKLADDAVKYVVAQKRKLEGKKSTTLTASAKSSPGTEDKSEGSSLRSRK